VWGVLKQLEKRKMRTKFYSKNLNVNETLGELSKEIILSK
jgi:hypothetical protein